MAIDTYFINYLVDDPNVWCIQEVFGEADYYLQAGGHADLWAGSQAERPLQAGGRISNVIHKFFDRGQRKQS